MPTLDEVIDSVTDAWMAATSDYVPVDADPEALADHRGLCRNEVELFLAVLSMQPEAVRSALILVLAEEIPEAERADLARQIAPPRTSSTLASCAA